MAKRVVVIGGGAIGLCAAYELHSTGCDVSVIERGKIGEGSSLHNAGLVVPSHFVPLAAPGMVGTGLRYMLNPASPFYIKPRLDGDLVRWLWNFARASTAARVEKAMPLLRDLAFASASLFDELSKIEGMDFEYRKNGLLMLFRTEHGRAGAIKAAEAAAKIGVEARVLTNAGLHDLEPAVKFNATGGVYYPGDAHLTPALLVERLRSYLERSNVRLITSADVTGFTASHAHIGAVTTTNGTYEADEFVLAGGSWSPSILRPLRITLPMQPGKGYSVTVRRAAIRPRMPFLLEEARVAITPMGDRLRFAGTMELSGFDMTINMMRVRAILRAVPAYIAGTEGAVDQSSDIWCGLRPCTPDGLPFLGRFRQYENLIAATGHAMIGISLAPITGKLVAEIVHGQIPSIDLHLLRPDRYA